MALKLKTQNLNEIAEPLRPLYRQNGEGVWQLDVEMPEAKSDDQSSLLGDLKSKVAEFRETNIGLTKTVEELRQKLSSFEGIDPHEYKNMKSKVDDLAKKGVKGTEDLASIVSRAVNEVVAPLQKQIGDLQADRESARAELARKEMETTLTQAALAAGVVESALPDFLRRGSEVFRNVNGKVIAMKGDVPMYVDGSEVTPDVWSRMLQNEAPHLFKPSRGAGATTSQITGVPANSGGRSVVVSDALDFGRKAEEIAKGGLTVVRSGQ